MQIFLFTDNFPYAFSEAFLESELPFLAAKFDTVHIIPLFGKGNRRKVAKNVNVWSPILGFNPRNRYKLLMSGLFNLSPCLFAVEEFFKKKVYNNRAWTWNFFSSLLLFRAIAANKKMLAELEIKLKKKDKLYFYWGSRTALIAPLLKKKKTNSVLVRFHRSDLYEDVNGGYIPFRATSFSAIDQFLPISEDGKNYLKDRYRINENKIQVSRLGVFDRGNNPVPATKQSFHLVSCSNIIPVKRLSLIVEALKMIDFQVLWTHIGAGKLYDEISKSAQSLPKNIQVNFVGQMSNSQVIEFYQQNPVDLFINVSASEGVPVSIMEALSFGIPVVATDVGGTSELVDSTVGKLLPSAVSAHETAEAIKELAKADLQNLRQNAKKCWATYSDAQKNYRDFSEFISTV